jgi:hypothetical protein
MPYTVAGIDIHKKVLMVVVVQQIGGRTGARGRRGGDGIDGAVLEAGVV